MRKNKIGISIVVATLVLGIGLYVSTSFLGSDNKKQHTGNMEEKDVITSLTNAIDEVVTKVDDGEKEFSLDMTEDDIQNAIHHMSHAKVYAVEKWSHLEPTQKRIDQLLNVVERNQTMLDYGDLYLRILKKWQAGDFREAVTDHNSIWDLQGGTIGEATRLLTEDEQAAYKENHF